MAKDQSTTPEPPAPEEVAEATLDTPPPAEGSAPASETTPPAPPAPEEEPSGLCPICFPYGMPEGYTTAGCEHSG